MQQAVEILGQIAPHMITVAYVSVAIGAIAFLALISRLLTGKNNWIVRLGARLLMLLGVVFVVYEGAISATGFVPADTAFYGYPFWVLGAALFVVGFVFRLLGALRPTR
jgi:DMSO/TMAO reductase YedYZ heme-binding membrane subunit